MTSIPLPADGLYCTWCSEDLSTADIYYCDHCKGRYGKNCLLDADAGYRCPACFAFCRSWDAVEPHIRVSYRHNYKRRAMSPSIKDRIRDRDDYTCQYCGEPNSGHVDHILPYSKGGSDKDSNLVTSCMICNLVASNRVFTTFEDKREFIRLRRIEKRIDTDRRYSICTDCFKIYPFGSEGATMFLCAACSRADVGDNRRRR